MNIKVKELADKVEITLTEANKKLYLDKALLKTISHRELIDIVKSELRSMK